MIIECRQCGQELRLPPNTDGKKIRCPQCRFEFIVDSRSLHDQLIEAIFKPDLVVKYVTLLDNAMDDPFPFSSREYIALQWHLRFPLVGYAFHELESPERDNILEYFIRRCRSEEQIVRVGDYINAKGHTSLIKAELGIKGFFSAIREQRIPIKIVTEALIDQKIKQMLALLNIAKKNHGILGWQNYKEIADEYSFCILMSYWGRIPDEASDFACLNGISELIYTKTIEIGRIITPSNIDN